VEKRLIGLQIEAEYQRGGQLQETIQVHAHYFLSQIAGLFALPDVWPTNEGEFLVAQSNFAVGIGVANAFLDEVGTTYARVDSDGNNRGKARGVDFSGLLPLQHRWCKAIVQTYIMPSLLESTLHALYLTLPDQLHARLTFLFPLIVSLSERLFGWEFVVEEPFAGLEGPISVERQTQLLKQDESAEDSPDEVEDKEEEENTRIDRPNFRSIPSIHANFLSRDVISVLHLAYEYAQQLEKQSHREASYCIVEIGKAIMGIATYRLLVQSEADRQLTAESKKGQIDCIIAIARQTCKEEYSNEAKKSSSLYGNSLLFVSQLFLCFLTSSHDKEVILGSVELSGLLNSLTTLTESVFRFAFGPPSKGFEEDELSQLGDEAINNVLSSWRALLPHSYEGASGSATETIKSAVFSGVVQPYIRCRLVSAGSSTQEEEEEASEVGQESESDSAKYEEQLILLASLSRDSNLTACIGFLLEVCSPLTRQVETYYREGHNSTPFTEEELKGVKKVWEQTHWITLIVGHILADQSKGEVAVLAQEISFLGIEGQNGVLHLIHSLGFTLLELFTKPSNRLQSPLVIQTVLWFNARWIPIYLLINSTPHFSAQFNGPTGQEMLGYLLLHLQGAVSVWGADADVVLQIAAVIKSFTLSEGVMQILLGLDNFQSSVKAITEGLDILPAKTHGPLLSSIVGCIYSSSPTQSPEMFFEYIKQAIESRLSRVIHQPNFATAQVSQRSDTISSLLNALDMLDGLASSIQPKSSRAVYDFISRFFDTLVGLVQLYSERTEVVTSIVRVYHTLTGSLDLGFGAEPHMIIGLNSAVSSLLNVVNERNLLGADMEIALEEDVPFEGFSLVIELLSDLMLASENDSADVRLWMQPLSRERTSDVCLQGFSRVTSMLNNDTRSVARVRRRFANLTSKLWISFPHRVVGILVSGNHQEGINLFQSCISALVISLRFVESNLIVDCFEAIRQLSMASEKVLNMVNSTLPPALQEMLGDALMSILKTLLRGILIDPLATSLLDVHLLSTRSLLQSLASEKMGGTAPLENKIHQFCSSTSLVSEHRSKINNFSARERDNLRPEEEVKKRRSLNQVILQLATLCLAGQRASVHSSQGREDESTFLKEARKVAWEGRAKIRAV